MVEVGDRVGAVRNADENTVWMYGWGEFMGDRVPERGSFKEIGIRNPTIKLDGGDLVYGFECWWGPAEAIRQKIGDREIKYVSINREEDDDE